MPNPNDTWADFRAAWEETETLPAEVLEVCRAILSGASAPGLEQLRDERGKRTFRAEIYSGAATGKFVVKEFGPRGPVDALFLRHLRPGPGRRYPHAAAAIREAGVLTPVVRFVASYDGPDGPRYLIGAEQIEGTRMLGEILTGLPAQERAGLFHTVGQAVARLHRAGLFHFDLNEDNLLFCGVSSCLTGPHLVDLDYTVRVPLKRRRLCRVLARLDLHQFFTTRSVDLSKEDGRMFEEGYRCAGGYAHHADWRFIPPRRRYPRWKRQVGTSMIHLFRGALLVCRLVR